MSTPLRTAGAAAVMAAWAGAAVLLAAAVAPAAFDTLTREQAGNVVGRILPIVFMSGMGVSAVAVALAFPRDWWRRGAALAVVVSCAVAEFVIGPRIAAVRDAMGGAVSSIDPGDPQRILFGRLHAMSVAWLGVAMLAALVFIVLSLRATRAHSQEQS